MTRHDNKISAAESQDEFDHIELVRGTYMERRKNGSVVARAETGELNYTGEAYASVFCFSRALKQVYSETGSVKGVQKLPCHADYLWIDIDRDDLEIARKDTLSIVNRLVKEFGVQADDISIYFSGQKGFHIGIPSSLFGPEAHVDLPKRFRSLAIGIAGALEIDTTIYHHTGLLRLPGSKHPKSGLFKIKITYTELKELSIEDIKVKASNPQQVECYQPRFPATISPLLAKAYRATKTPQKFSRATFSTLPCIRAMLDGAEEGNRHHYTVRLASDLRRHSVNEQKAVDMLLEWNSRLCNPPRRESEVIQDVKDIYRLNHPHSCNDPILANLCGNNCPQKIGMKQLKKIESTFGVDLQSRHYVVIDDKGTPRFLILDKTGQITTDKVAISGASAVAVPLRDLRTDVREGHAFLATGLQDYSSETQLLQDVTEFIQRYMQLPEHDAKLCALYVMGTYLYDQFNCFPYLNILGEPGVGKTRLKDLLLRTVFLGVPHSGSSSEATLFRITDRVKGTVVADENDMLCRPGSDSRVSIWKQGFEKGNPVQRVKETKDGDDYSKKYNVYCPKIATTIGPILDYPLNQRCIKIRLVHRPHDKPIQLPQDVDSEAQILRNKLLKYRFDKLAVGGVEIAPITGDFDGRAMQVLAPLLAISPDEATRKILLNKMGQHHVASTNRPHTDLQLQLIEALDYYLNRDKEPQCQELKGRIAAQGYGVNITAKKIGTELGILGFARTRKGGKTVVTLSAENKQLLARLKQSSHI